MTGLPAEFPVRVWMLSDWIVGTGESRAGDTDATVRRDQDGLPFLPGKSLTGIWRDACEQVAAWIDATDRGSSTAGPWLAWVDWLFGSQPDAVGDRVAAAGRSPQPAALALSPAAMPQALRDACRGRPALLAAAVTVRPGVQIDEADGVAADDTLRLEERARPGILEARARFPFQAGGDVPAAAEFLLRAGAAIADGLGGKRNRGAGRCWILLPGMDLPGDQPPVPADPRPADPRLAELAASSLLDDPGEPPPLSLPATWLAAPVAGGQAALDGNAPDDAGRVTWQVALEVLTPVIAQSRVLGNVVMSRDWVPGTVLLPAILSRLGQPAGAADVSVGDARPAARGADGIVPGLPAPMTWHRYKERHRRDVVNAAIRPVRPQERLSPMRSGHIAGSGYETWRLLVPDVVVSTHAVIGDQTGRPDDRRGGVFSYAGIAPGTVLVSDIVLPSGVRPGLAAGDELSLGRSRKDDFGRVRVMNVSELPAPPQSAGIPAGGDVLAWCLSDVLLRDPWGAYSPSPQALAAALTRLLGTGVQAVPQETGSPAASAFRAARRESFHSRWGRPRPSLAGLAAGSVIRLRVAGDVPPGALTRIEQDGIGERVTEGFGRVRFGAPELTAPDPVLITGNRDVAGRPERGSHGTPRPGDADGPGLPPAPHILEDAAVRAEIARAVARLVAEPDAIDRVIPGASGVSSRAQWGSLREQLARLGTAPGRESVARWLAQTREVRQRRLAWGLPALDTLERLLTTPDAVWAELGLHGDALDDCLLGPGRAEAVRAALWADADAALLTGIVRVCSRRLQAARGQGEGQ